ncbi:sulfite exporter TauE/SafE family protein [Methylophaga sp.]|uniref:sulfite exporter TauE/SafE family protein n=1 Tax=Methylophaga sp. TaxID=2024840 RepID=UPI003F69751D
MFLFIGLIIGVVLGLTGSGGSVFAVPLLVMLGGLSMHQAVGLSLATVAASAVFGLLRFNSRQTVLWVPALLLIVSGLLSVPLGQWLGAQLPSSILVVAFVALAVIIAIKMWRQANLHPERASITRASNPGNMETEALLCRLSPTGQFQLKPRCMGGLLTGGLVIGFLSGLLGVGGGFIIVPLLLLLSQISMQRAVSTSLLVISFISTAGFISYLMVNQATAHESLHATIGWLIPGGILGMFIGQKLTTKIADSRLQKGFSLALILMAISMFFFTFIGGK